eukprot:29229-Prymnesium_polylepis.1
MHPQRPPPMRSAPLPPPGLRRHAGACGALRAPRRRAARAPLASCATAPALTEAALSTAPRSGTGGSATS